MKKLVIKTVAITLASIILLAGLLFGLFTLVSPKVIGNLFAKTGSYNIPATFYEKQYNDKLRTEDLTVLVDFLDAKLDAERTEKYSLILISENDFKDNLGDAEYYYGKYVLSAYFNGNLDDALLKCKDFIERFGYTKHNPIRTLLYDDTITFTTEELSSIKEAINNASQVVDTETIVYQIRDLTYINNL